MLSFCDFSLRLGKARLMMNLEKVLQFDPNSSKLERDIDGESCGTFVNSSSNWLGSSFNLRWVLEPSVSSIDGWVVLGGVGEFPVEKINHCFMNGRQNCIALSQ